jgi:Mor family transcriptional regulator
MKNFKNTGIEKIERNRKIYEYWKSHKTDYAVLGRRYNLSRQAVRAIILRMKTKEVHGELVPPADEKRIA